MMAKNLKTEIRISDQPLNSADNICFVSSDSSGGINVFIGTVRNETNGRVVRYLEFEAYETMAVKELEVLVGQAAERWPLEAVSVHHRTGRVDVCGIAVVIAVSAAHRDAAFRGCRYIIDELKKSVPIWKKEVFHDGEVWVSAHP